MITAFAGHLDGVVRYLGRADVLAALDRLDPVAAVRDALVDHARGAARVADEAHLVWTTPAGGRGASESTHTAVTAAVRSAEMSAPSTIQVTTPDSASNSTVYPLARGRPRPGLATLPSVEPLPRYPLN